jgi:hypothetical protein
MPRARRFAWVSASFVVVAVVAGACAETRRSQGEDCLKTEDCLPPYVCSALKCTAPPPILGNEPPFSDAGGTDVAPEASPAETGGDATDANAGG